MKTIRTRVGEALPPAHRTVYEQAAEQIRRMYSRRVLLWFLITAAAAAVLVLAAWHWTTLSPVSVFAFGFLAGFVVLWIMMSAAEQTCSTQRPPAPQPTGEQLTNDRNCMKEQEKLRSERGVLLIGAVFIFPLIPLFLLIASLRARFIKERPGTAGYASALYASYLSRRINAVSFFFLPALLMCMMLPAAWQRAGYGRITSMNQTAHAILSAAGTYKTDLDENGSRPEWKTVIISPDDTAEEGSIQFGVETFMPNMKDNTLWYAVVIDGQGSPCEAYCSRSPLTADDLTPPDLTEQRKLASSPFRVREIIGYWNRETGAVQQ